MVCKIIFCSVFPDILDKAGRKTRRRRRRRTQAIAKRYAFHANAKKLSEYICRHLKYHHHRIRGKTGISLVITLNVSKFLEVSLVALKFLLWQ